MRKLMIITVVFILAIASNLSAQKSFSGQQDISELMKIAEQNFNLVNEDAVILFDDFIVSWLPYGRQSKFVHQIVWINSRTAIRRYGDHRIAYDKEHCDLRVAALRTWRDNQWWETGETGIVETTPYALDDAYDYTNIREMMLLHNGIELPCILEVAYVIEDKEPFRSGIGGIHIFPQNDPVVRSSFGFGPPKGVEPNVYVSAELGEPEIDSDKSPHIDVWSWKGGPYSARPRPHSDRLEDDVPYIIWSTWDSWKTLGNYIKETFEAKLTLNESLQKQTDSLLKEARTNTEKATLITDFIDQRVRHVGYNERFWQNNIREAQRTYETAYGHNLDLAILAGATFKYAGLNVFPSYFGKGNGMINDIVPTLSQVGNLHVWVSGENVEAVYDPNHGALKMGLNNIFGRAVWMPGTEDKPTIRIQGDKEHSRFEINIDLEYDDENDNLTGDGFLYGDNCFNPYGQMVGLDDEAISYISDAASGIIENIEITEYNPSRFDLFCTTVGFRCGFEVPEKDDYDRIPFILGDPADGILNHLDDIDVVRVDHGSTINLQCLMHQKITFKLNTEGLEIVHVPETKSVKNSAGVFKVETIKEENKLIVIREIKLAKTVYKAEDWSALRELLLTEKHDRNRTVLVKKE